MIRVVDRRRVILALVIGLAIVGLGVALATALPNGCFDTVQRQTGGAFIDPPTTTSYCGFVDHRQSIRTGIAGAGIALGVIVTALLLLRETKKPPGPEGPSGA